ncbi:hypothetical protein SAMN06297251_11294 [Fulvimarina manganoxydans]|uniref:Uncharacterized protein n=1 Tax=Fulvimarina manganoxydans TaxID=937218 RepID=A0A1W2D4E7_9HYPH|nr:hypothetical protein [Fulvimarina manganoxydans]SMC91962.1 hypothetical protein SAMN06297251_11294 [Fulvimarina manganoxydans]
MSEHIASVFAAPEEGRSENRTAGAEPTAQGQSAKNEGPLSDEQLDTVAGGRPLFIPQDAWDRALANKSRR